MQGGISEVQEVEGFEFSINGCKRLRKTATCSFTIVNKQKDRYLSFFNGHYGTILVDNLGNSYSPDLIQLENCREKKVCRKIIVDKLPTRASFVINGVSPEATFAAKVALVCDKNDGKRFSVSFQNVVFSE